MKYATGPLIAVLATLLSLTLAEAGLTVFAPLVDPYEDLKTRAARPVNQYIRSQFPPNFQLTFEAEEGLPGVRGRNTFSTNNAGFRGDDIAYPKPAHEYRVFMVGGSTTECLILDDDDAISTVLQRELQARLPKGPTVRVYNAGKSGDRIDDHLSMIVHRLILLRPDMLIVFAGINDLRAAMYGYDYLHYPIADQASPEFGRDVTEFQRTGPDLGLSRLLRLTAAEFQIGRRLYYLLRSPEETLLEIPLKSDIRKRVEIRKAAPRVADSPRLNLAAYRANLLTIVAAAEVHDIRLVVMTQLATWNSSVDPEMEDWHWMLRVNNRSIAPR